MSNFFGALDSDDEAPAPKIVKPSAGKPAGECSFEMDFFAQIYSDFGGYLQRCFDALVYTSTL